MNRKATILYLLIVIFLAFSINLSLFSKKKGIVNRTNTNSVSCGECHSAVPDPSITLELISETGNFVVEPGNKIKITLKMTTTKGVTSGCNIAVKTMENGNQTAGTLEPFPNSGLILSKNELTHSTPKPIVNGTVTFDFYWNAPTTPGTYYLQAVALAANGNNKEDNNDVWNFAPVQQLIVQAASKVETDNPPKIFSISLAPEKDKAIVKINDYSLFIKLDNIWIVNLYGMVYKIYEKSPEGFASLVNSLPSGLYFLHYQLDGKTFTEKFLK